MGLCVDYLTTLSVALMNDWMINEYELERIWKESFVT